ncbi:MAG: YfaP family protein, partial [Clostridium sp.]
VDADINNTASILGVTMEGIEMKETVPLITMGVKFAPGPSLIPSMTLNGIQDSSVATPYTPIVTIMVLMDMKGELSFTAKIGFDNKEHIEKGFNIQDKEYEGIDGGIDSVKNKGQERYNLAFGRVMDVYDINSEDDLNLSAPAKKAIKGNISGKLELELGLGAGIGFFMMGFSPAMARVVGYINFSAVGLEGEFQIADGKFSSDFEKLNLSCEAGTKVKVNARIKVPLASFESTYNKTYKLFSTGKDSKIKIVLTWSDLPSDLDSHLFTPTNDHIYYRNKVKYKTGTTEKQVELDYDYTSGFGPETTTINGPDQHGTYSFYVKDFSNGGSLNSTALSKSRAVVKVYMEGTEVETFVVPTDKIGTNWHVFDYDPEMEKIKSINEISNTYIRGFDDLEKKIEM